MIISIVENRLKIDIFDVLMFSISSLKNNDIFIY